MDCEHDWIGGADVGLNLRTRLPELRVFVYCALCGVEREA